MISLVKRCHGMSSMLPILRADESNIRQLLLREHLFALRKAVFRRHVIARLNACSFFLIRISNRHNLHFFRHQPAIGAYISFPRPPKPQIATRIGYSSFSMSFLSLSSASPCLPYSRAHLKAGR